MVQLSRLLFPDPLVELPPRQLTDFVGKGHVNHRQQAPSKPMTAPEMKK